MDCFSLICTHCALDGLRQNAIPCLAINGLIKLVKDKEFTIEYDVTQIHHFSHYKKLLGKGFVWNNEFLSITTSEFNLSFFNMNNRIEPHAIQLELDQCWKLNLVYQTLLKARGEHTWVDWHKIFPDFVCSRCLHATF